MVGGCADYSWDMQCEMAAWDQRGFALSALADVDVSPEFFSMLLDWKLDLMLHLLAATRFVAPLERKSEAGYVGVVVLSVFVDGVYWISAGSCLWIDVVDK